MVYAALWMMRGENLLSTLSLLAHRRNAAKLLQIYDYIKKYSVQLKSPITTSPDLNCYDTPCCCHDINSPRSPPYSKCEGKFPFGIDTRVDAFLNTTIFPFSIQGLIVIYSPYLHNLPFLPSTLSFIH